MLNYNRNFVKIHECFNFVKHIRITFQQIRRAFQKKTEEDSIRIEWKFEDNSKMLKEQMENHFRRLKEYTENISDERKKIK